MQEQLERRLRLLVIEDEPKLASLLCRTLSATGYEVASAGNGVEGLALACEDDFDLIVLDLLLPDLDGFAILEQLVRRRPGQQVLVLSALSDVGSKVRCLEFGAVDFVAKPFELAELLARVRRRVRPRQSEGAQGVLRSGPLSLDLQRRRATVAGSDSVSLSTREFLVLEYIMRKEGQVCTREELLAQVWGYSFDPGTNVVDVCVGRLRQKLRGAFIETIRNVGYCFVAP
jgi:two-component system, OmpR family, response regulator